MKDRNTIKNLIQYFRDPEIESIFEYHANNLLKEKNIIKKIIKLLTIYPDIMFDLLNVLFSLFDLKKGLYIEKPPGYLFSALGKVIFTKKSYERVVEPAITMMQEEYFGHVSNRLNRV